MTGLRCDPVDSAQVLDVYAGSPAAEAGIKAGDRLLSINGEPMERWNGARLRDLTQKSAPGTGLELQVKRGERAWKVRLLLREFI